MRDAYMYCRADEESYKRQLALEEDTLTLAIEPFRKMTTEASQRDDVSTHRSANDLLLAWYNPLILVIRHARDRAYHAAISSSKYESKTSENSVTAYQHTTILPGE